MSVAIQLEELLDYSDHERAKWKAWVTANPKRLQLTFQPGGRFPTVGALFDHLFLVERRHLSRLRGATAPDSTGLALVDWEGLFDYGALVRKEFRQCLAEMDDAAANETLTFTAKSGTFAMTRRKLAVHMVLHEIRHLAQLAYAARLAGQDPPGAHDLAFFEGIA